LKFREAVKLPLIYVGGLIARDKIDMVLDSGFEFVAMARALVNDPNFVNRLKNEGNVRCNCEHANYCIGRMYTVEMQCYQQIKDELPKCIRKEIEKTKRH
jgi:2,4-dienoyl-CoA reductase-like NADH-dependent reductase (Old Yellow Enzyme family)